MQSKEASVRSLEILRVSIERQLVSNITYVHRYLDIRNG